MTGQALTPAPSPRKAGRAIVVNFIPMRKGYAGNVLWSCGGELSYHRRPYGFGGHPYVTSPAVSRAEARHVATLLRGMGYYASPFPEGDGMIFQPSGSEGRDMTDSETRELASALALASGWDVLVDASETRPGQAPAGPCMPPWIAPRCPAAEGGPVPDSSVMSRLRY
jgi:hypothetical protein